MSISGNQLKKALKIADLTQDVAADKLGVSRQTINSWCKQAVLDDSILQNVKEKLNIDFTNPKDYTNKEPELLSETILEQIKKLNDSSSHQIELLEKLISDKEEEIKRLHHIIDKKEQTISDRDKTIEKKDSYILEIQASLQKTTQPQ